MNYRLQWSVATDKGTVRKLNEDSVLVHPDEEELTRGGIALPPEGRLCIVADGMGGHRGGQEASSTAVRKITQYYYNQHGTAPIEALYAAIQQTSREITLFGQSSTEFERMGTTVVLVVSQDNYIYVANVGDSRAYLWRNRELLQLSQDDSWVAHQVQMGTLTPEQARTHHQRNVLMQYLGIDRPVEPHIIEAQLQPGDRLLLCTDGVTEVLDDAQLCHLLGNLPAHELPGKLVQLAMQKGAKDNVTAAVSEYAVVTQPAGRAQSGHTSPIWGRWLDVRKLAIGFLLMLIGLVVLAVGGIIWGTLSNSLLHGRSPANAANGTLIIATITPTPHTSATTNVAAASTATAAPTMHRDDDIDILLPAATATAIATTTTTATIDAPPPLTSAPVAPSLAAMHRAEARLPRIDIWQPDDVQAQVVGNLDVQAALQSCATQVHPNGVAFVFVRDEPLDEVLHFSLRYAEEQSAPVAVLQNERARCVVFGEHNGIEAAGRIRKYTFELGSTYLLHYTSTPVPVFAATPTLAQQAVSEAERAAASQCGNIANTNDALVIVSTGTGSHTVSAVVGEQVHDLTVFADTDCYTIDSSATRVRIDAQVIDVELEPGAFAIVRAAEGS
jgi:protein phosphatase